MTKLSEFGMDGGFDSASVEPNEGLDLLPKAWYRCIIKDSGIKTTKAGDGKYLDLCIQVIDGVGKGRKVWDNLNLDNPNEKAVEIAKGTLSAICRAVNVPSPQDSAELHNKPLLVHIGLDEYNGQQKNKVLGYKADEGTPAATETDEIPF